MVSSHAALCALLGENPLVPPFKLGDGEVRFFHLKFAESWTVPEKKVKDFLEKTTKLGEFGGNLKKSTYFIHSLFIVPRGEIE